jgi:hypothetical protein
MKDNEIFICIGCQCNRTSEEVIAPSPCPGLLCKSGNCLKHNKACSEGGGCRPSQRCKLMIKKVAREEQLDNPDKDKILKYNMLHCGNKGEKCMGCVSKLPFIKNIG